jgi:hypothetical protein
MSELRASDADRERSAERLRAAAAEGRLTAEELEERLERAFSARTESELTPLVADLPPAASPSAPPAAPERRRRRGPDPDHLRAYIAVNVMLVAIWALTGAGYFWPIWPILGWGVGLVADSGGRLRGPCGRRSSSPGSSTARLRSSAAAAPGSAERLR